MGRGGTSRLLHNQMVEKEGVVTLKHLLQAKKQNFIG
jgi:hypothetical protein